MRLATAPASFDVMLADNLFGDILSDQAASIAGSLGVLPSATIGGRVDLYEPVHGSAPDIAGKGWANPIGAIASAAMLLRFTAGMEREAGDIEHAIEDALAAGARTRDLAASGRARALHAGDGPGHSRRVDRSARAAATPTMPSSATGARPARCSTRSGTRTSSACSTTGGACCTSIGTSCTR